MNPEPARGMTVAEGADEPVVSLLAIYPVTSAFH